MCSSGQGGRDAFVGVFVCRTLVKNSLIVDKYCLAYCASHQGDPEEEEAATSAIMHDLNYESTAITRFARYSESYDLFARWI